MRMDAYIEMLIAITLWMALCLYIGVTVSDKYEPAHMPPEVSQCMKQHMDVIHCDKSYDYWLSYCRHEYETIK